MTDEPTADKPVADEPVADKPVADKPVADKPESKESLWWLVVSPAIWAAHFLASYITVAVWCAKKAGPEGLLGGARIAVICYTALALPAVVATAGLNYRRHRFSAATVPHDFDSPESRHRFLGFATLLLSVLSAIAIVYVTLPVIFIRTCQ